MSQEKLDTASSFSSSNNNPSSHATSALHILLSPDGYYTYLQIKKQPTTAKSLLSSSTKKDENDKSNQNYDKSKIEKNYRRLSLKLHPDRPGGDAETFRVLERAKCVLMSDKLRKEYDLVGLDLEEEDNHDKSQENDTDGDDQDEKKSDSGSSGNPDSVIGQMASVAVAGMLQLAVRTAMMAFVSLFITKYKYTTIPIILFLFYTSFKINKARRGSNGALIGFFDVASPLFLSVGIFLMYSGRLTLSDGNDESSTANRSSWSWTFWAGEAIVMTMFALNSVTGQENSVLIASVPLGIGLFILFMLVCLWIRGKTWRYVTILGFEVGLALLACLIFPIMEMILEEIMNEKLKKVGDKVRLYSKVMEESYNMKLEEQKRNMKGGGDNGSQKFKSGISGSESLVGEID
mmetsp:Transcript_19224/g.22228  ORF Transcript_19224/g.22228 Transcript_19224/m.22228 type:complete len:405 (-) Transcript_19224:111-1325(-)